MLESSLCSRVSGPRPHWRLSCKQTHHRLCRHFSRRHRKIRLENYPRANLLLTSPALWASWGKFSFRKSQRINGLDILMDNPLNVVWFSKWKFPSVCLSRKPTSKTKGNCLLQPLFVLSGRIAMKPTRSTSTSALRTGRLLNGLQPGRRWGMTAIWLLFCQIAWEPEKINILLFSWAGKQECQQISIW